MTYLNKGLRSQGTIISHFLPMASTAQLPTNAQLMNIHSPHVLLEVLGGHRRWWDPQRKALAFIGNLDWAVAWGAMLTSPSTKSWGGVVLKANKDLCRIFTTGFQTVLVKPSENCKVRVLCTGKSEMAIKKLSH